MLQVEERWLCHIKSFVSWAYGYAKFVLLGRLIL
jgi:hypothetical protein